MVELADRLQCLPQLVVIAQPAAHILNLFAAQAKLAGPAAGIADGQNPQRVPAAAADRAAAGMMRHPLDQRAAQNLPGDGQLGNQRLTRPDGRASWAATTDQAQTGLLPAVG
jgi:hypothetical protein